MPAEPQPDEDPADLADGLRELGDVWRVGLDSAQVMAERVLDLYRNLPATARMAPGDPDAELRRVRIDLERAVDLSVDVFDRVLALARASTRRSATAAAGRARGRRPRGHHGGAASTGLWVHNVWLTSSARPGSVAARSRLRRQRDRGVSARRRRPQPIEARNSRAVEVSVEVPVGTPVGTYHGLILSGDDPDTSMRVRVRVTE